MEIPCLLFYLKNFNFSAKAVEMERTYHTSVAIQVGRKHSGRSFYQKNDPTTSAGRFTCFHNGIILIVISFKLYTKYNRKL